MIINIGKVASHLSGLNNLVFSIYKTSKYKNADEDDK